MTVYFKQLMSLAEIHNCLVGFSIIAKQAVIKVEEDGTPEVKKKKVRNITNIVDYRIPIKTHFYIRKCLEII